MMLPGLQAFAEHASAAATDAQLQHFSEEHVLLRFFPF
jgi:hypothetical protein